MMVIGSHRAAAIGAAESDRAAFEFSQKNMDRGKTRIDCDAIDTALTPAQRAFSEVVATMLVEAWLAKLKAQSPKGDLVPQEGPAAIAYAP